MKKFFITALLPILITGCANNYPTNSMQNVKVNPIPPKHTFVKNEKASKPVFRKDDHRYDPRYRNFDYDRLGYSNNKGLYYGYFDHNGYFYNNIYFSCLFG